MNSKYSTGILTNIYIACIIQALCVAGEFEPATGYHGPIIRTLEGEWKSIKPRQLGDLWNIATLFFQEKWNEIRYTWKMNYYSKKCFRI